MRTHVILPEDLVRSVDALAGKGKRSQFIEEAIREKVRIDTLRAAL
ncbi:MAG: ribbon-helix-helix protein, CopG family, partial [Chloroflexi bacterium]|nr:ribbon-helix-helix protein, CopG family [Chloroflexota bacterium]